MPKSSEKKHSIVLRVIIFAVSIYMIITLVNLWQNFIGKKNELDALERQKAEKTAEIDRLVALLDGGSEDEIIEKAARERLGYVYAGEQVYIDISGN